MKDLLNFGQMLSAHARITPDRTGARDLDRTMSFALWNERACRLANALLGLGLNKGDRVAVLAYNCVEWCEIFAATAKAGLVALPINSRLIGKEIHVIVDDAEAAAFIVQDDLVGVVEEIRKDLPIRPDRFIHFGTRPCPAGYSSYEPLMAAGSSREPTQAVAPKPVNVLTPGLSVDTLEGLGVRRISVGGGLASVAYGALRVAARHIAETGEFDVLSSGMPGRELNSLFQAGLRRPA